MNEQTVRQPGPGIAVRSETPADIAARDALVDRAMGPNWRRKARCQSAGERSGGA